MEKNVRMQSSFLRERVSEIVRLSLWGEGHAEIDEEMYLELKKQAIFMLPAAVLPKLNIPSGLRTTWMKDIYQQLTYNVNCQRIQEKLPISNAYVILKGTTAAQYYPHPKFRVLGDIDIMPRREDFEATCQALLSSGYTEVTQHGSNGVVRHRVFQRESYVVEVHSYFAILSDPRRSQYLDDLIIDGINPSHILPDLVNGLVLLEHVSQHLEEGLGLRQVIDWMMFVHQCLPDEKWAEFHEMAINAGLDTLAAFLTRMCIIYFGLPERKWCADADENVCARLMDYILQCGNFGSKREYSGFRSEKLMSYMRTPSKTFILLQRYGRYNWKASQKYWILRPFAWIYQIRLYIKKTLSRNVSFGQIRKEYKISRERNALFDDLNIPQASKGLTVFHDGKYTVKK